MPMKVTTSDDLMSSARRLALPGWCAGTERAGTRHSPPTSQRPAYCLLSSMSPPANHQQPLPCNHRRPARLAGTRCLPDRHVGGPRRNGKSAWRAISCCRVACRGRRPVRGAVLARPGTTAHALPEGHDALAAAHRNSRPGCPARFSNSAHSAAISRRLRSSSASSVRLCFRAPARGRRRGASRRARPRAWRSARPGGVLLTHHRQPLVLDDAGVRHPGLSWRCRTKRLSYSTATRRNTRPARDG